MIDSLKDGTRPSYKTGLLLAVKAVTELSIERSRCNNSKTHIKAEYILEMKLIGYVFKVRHPLSLYSIFSPLQVFDVCSLCVNIFLYIVGPDRTSQQFNSKLYRHLPVFRRCGDGPQESQKT